MKVGNKLKNRSILLAWKEERDGIIVLSLKKHEFVTWELDPSGNAYCGHYFPDLLSAMKDFKTRS